MSCEVDSEILALCDELGIKRRGNGLVCQCCGLRKDRHHCTTLGELDGLPLGGPCPLCQDCWGAMEPAERVPFYRRLYDYNRALDERFYKRGYDADGTQWEVIERAVLSGA